MILKENESHFAGWSIEILATDISREVLANAVEGKYSQFEVQRGLSIALMVKYVKEDGGRRQIDDSIRRMVTFKPFNLPSPSICSTIPRPSAIATSCSAATC